MALSLLYLFAISTVVFWIPLAEGDESSLIDPGIVVHHQGEPLSVAAQKKRELLLNCSVTKSEASNSDITISWRKDGVQLDLDKLDLEKLPNGSLHFRKVVHKPRKSRSDEGLYECIASNEFGSIIARRVRVEIASIARNFSKQPQSQTAVVGGVARFQCEITAVPPALYVWERKPSALPQNDIRFTTISSGILQITNVQESDAGQYHCVATQGVLHNTIQRKISHDATLTVVNTGTENRSPRIVEGPSNVTALVGSTAVLECLVDGSVDSITWSRQDGEDPLGDDGRVKRVGGNLKFLRVKSDDQATYKCEVHKEGYSTLSTSRTLNVLKPPVLTDGPVSKTFVMAQWIRLPCVVKGIPKPTITWYTNGTKVKGGRFRKNKRGELTVTSSIISDSGYYQCVAENEVGYVTGFARVLVEKGGECIPEPPKNVTASNISATTVALTWLPAESKLLCKLLAYSVHCEAMGAGIDDIEINQVTSMTGVTLEELSPYTNYSVSVRAYTSQGAGLGSPLLIFQTKEDVPSRFPNMILEPRSTSIIVNWKKLSVTELRGRIVGYRIFYRHAGSTKEIQIPGNSTSYTIEGLEPETTYSLRMLAGTGAGYPRFTDTEWQWVEVRTHTTNASVHPFELNVVPINETSVSIMWKPLREMEFSSYTLTVHKLPWGSTTDIHVNSPAQKYTLTDLVTNSTYTVTLVGRNRYGDSTPITEEFQVAKKPVPPAPRRLRIDQKTTNSVMLEWDQPMSTFTIKYFNVKYRKVHIGPFQEKKSDTTSVEITGLDTFTSYEFFVRAHHTDDTFSLYSQSYEAMTAEGVPSEPRNVQGQVIKPGEVILKWVEPEKPNGKITSYMIMYKEVVVDPLDPWEEQKKNGTETMAVIADLKIRGMYQFKLAACTRAGAGKPSIYELQVQPPEDPPVTPVYSGDDQKLGIIIGVSIGLVCIIICILIVLMRNRCFNTNYNQPQTQPVRFHGNGHVPGQGNGHAIPIPQRLQGGNIEMESYTPMLGMTVTENEQCDSKGGGNGNVILTPNGARLTGFVPLKRNGIKNGQHMQHHNGQVTTFLSNHKEEALDPEESQRLLEAMLAASDSSRQCMAVPEDGFQGRCEDMGSLDDIDHSEDGENETEFGCGSTTDEGSINSTIRRDRVVRSGHIQGLNPGGGGTSGENAPSVVCSTGSELNQEEKSGQSSIRNIPQTSAPEEGENFTTTVAATSPIESQSNILSLPQKQQSTSTSSRSQAFSSPSSGLTEGAGSVRKGSGSPHSPKPHFHSTPRGRNFQNISQGAQSLPPGDQQIPPPPPPPLLQQEEATLAQIPQDIVQGGSWSNRQLDLRPNCSKV